MRARSNTKLPIDPIKYPFKSGYVSVDKVLKEDTTDQLFYIYFPSQTSPENDPLVVWFAGGPGCSAFQGVLATNGPFDVFSDKPDGSQPFTLVNRTYPANRNANMLYIDSPIGTGFSFSKTNRIVMQEPELTTDTYIFLSRWIEIDDFKGLKGRPLYITGESYSGEYVPFVGHRIFSENNPSLNLKGILVGNAWTNPAIQNRFFLKFAMLPENLNRTLMTNKTINTWLEQVDDLCTHVCLRDNFRQPLDRFYICNFNYEYIKKPTPEQIKEGKQYKFWEYNIDHDGPYDWNPARRQFMNSVEVRNQLGVKTDHYWEECSSWSGIGLDRADQFTNAAVKIVDLLEAGKKILMTTGERDYICNWKTGEGWMNALKWSGRQEFLVAKSISAQVKKEGFEYGVHKKFRNFDFLRIHSSGHSVFVDRPFIGLYTFNKFIGVDLPERKEYS